MKTGGVDVTTIFLQAKIVRLCCCCVSAKGALFDIQCKIFSPRVFEGPLLPTEMLKREIGSEIKCFLRRRHGEAFHLKNAAASTMIVNDREVLSTIRIDSINNPAKGIPDPGILGNLTS